MSLYDNLTKTADALLAKFGGEATLVRAITTYDPMTGETSETTRSIPVRAIVSVSKSTTETGTHWSPVATLTSRPAIGDILRLGSKSYKVTSRVDIGPIGKAMIYKAGVSDEYQDQYL